MAIVKNLKSKFRHKIVYCPQCQGKLRLPIKLGKTLLVNCPKCSANFELSYKDPWSQLKKNFTKSVINPLNGGLKRTSFFKKFLLYLGIILFVLILGFVLKPELGGQIGYF